MVIVNRGNTIATNIGPAPCEAGLSIGCRFALLAANRLRWNEHDGRSDFSAKTLPDHAPFSAR